MGPFPVNISAQGVRLNQLKHPLMGGATSGFGFSTGCSAWKTGRVNGCGASSGRHWPPPVALALVPTVWAALHQKARRERQLLLYLIFSNVKCSKLHKKKKRQLNIIMIVMDHLLISHLS